MTGSEAIAALPLTVRIGPYDFTVIKDGPLVSQSKGRWGECSTVEQRLSIQAEMPTPQKAVDTFFHEVMHAVFWAYNVADEDKEERIVGTLGTALTALHRDNPWLSSWVAQALA